MGFFSSAPAKKASELVLVVHVDSSSVAGAFVSIADGVTTVLRTASAEIAIAHDVAAADLEREMLAALRAMLASVSSAPHASGAAHAMPDRIAVYLGGPWYASQVRVARTSRATDFVASKSLLGDMISRELKAFEEEEMQASYAAGAPVRAIESKTVLVKLNGHPASAPLGLACKELELSIFVSIAPEALLAGIEDAIERTYKAPIRFATFLSASFIVTRDFFPHLDDYMLVDVGGEMTDVSLVRGGALARSVYFPSGRNSLLRRLASGLKRSVREAIVICRLFKEDKVERSVRDVCTDVLEDAKNDWLDAFRRAVYAESGERSIPETVLLSVGSDIAPWFAEAIARGAHAGKPPKVVQLDAAVFHESLKFAEHAQRNPFIMIDALAASR